MDMTDKRAFPRYATRVYGVFSRDIDLDETDALMTNMSLGGAFVRTDHPAPPGSPVTLKMYVEGSDVPISVAGEVVWWRRPGQGEEPGMGVKFMQVSAQDLERLKKYLASLVEQDLFR